MTQTKKPQTKKPQTKRKGIWTDEEKENFQDFLSKSQGQQMLDRIMPDPTGQKVVVHAWIIPSQIRIGTLFAHIFERDKRQQNWTYKGPYAFCGKTTTKKNRQRVKNKLLEIVHTTLM